MHKKNVIYLKHCKKSIILPEGIITKRMDFHSFSGSIEVSRYSDLL